jgi:hypothetical protein
MAKLPSAVRVVQSYLAMIPAKAELVSFPANKETWYGRGSNRFSRVVSESEVAVCGELGTARREVFRDPAGLISDFANTKSNPEGVLHFTKKYGALQRREMDYVGEIDDIGDKRLCVPCPRWLNHQKEFRDQWISKGKADEDTATAFANHIHPASSDSPAVKTFVIPGRHGAFQLEARPDELLGALWLALLGFSGRTRKCENPTCVAPYFIASRRDQKYCNEACSRLVANRKWWSEKGTQWRENRLKNERRKTR